MKIHTFRLRPGSKLRESIQKYANEKRFKAALILTVVGNLKSIDLRMAGASPDKQVVEKFSQGLEIVSVEGTLEKDDCHIHLSVSDKTGKVIGGHLKEAIVAFTAEIAMLELTDRKFLRKPDKETGFKELEIQ